MQMTIDLSDKQAEQFQQLAKSLSIPPQELVRAAIDDFLLRQAEDFSQAARYVFGALASAVAQSHMTFGGVDLYQTIQEKAATLCFSLVTNHPFVDGNKRVGHAAMETFLVLNNWELDATADVAERTILALADGTLSREEFVQWVNHHSKPR